MITKNILIIEDDLDILSALSDLLHMEGHVIHTAASRKEAETVLRSGLIIDLVLTDLGLPDVRPDGEIISFIRGVWSGSKICLISASKSSDVIAERYGVWVLRKPFSIEAIIQIASL